MISICGFAGTRRKYCALLAETCKRLLLRRKLSRYYAYPASVQSKITRYLPLAFYEKKKNLTKRKCPYDIRKILPAHHCRATVRSHKRDDRHRWDPIGEEFMACPSARVAKRVGKQASGPICPRTYVDTYTYTGDSDSPETRAMDESVYEEHPRVCGFATDCHAVSQYRISRDCLTDISSRIRPSPTEDDTALR